jgi:hypothetical protein
VLQVVVGQPHTALPVPELVIGRYEVTAAEMAQIGRRLDADENDQAVDWRRECGLVMSDPFSGNWARIGSVYA